MNATLPDDLDALPTKEVSAFIQAFAQAHGITYHRTHLDAWCEAVTRLSGDDIRSDDTANLLVALTRAKRITTAQMVRLLMNHLRERRSQGA